jgi:TolB protein
MRFMLRFLVVAALLAGCGKNQVTVEIKGGDGELLRLDANDLQYKFNKLVKAGTYVFPEAESKADLGSGSHTVSISAGQYLETKVLQLESPPISGVQDYKVTFNLPAGSNAAAQPQGTILFASTSLKKRDWDLFTVTADGSARRQLTDTPDLETHPSWSPDGKRILFTRGDVMTNFDIFVMDEDGGNVTRLTEHAERDQRPSWSPDGKTIAFVSQRDGDVAVWLMDADGGNKRKLAPGRQPSWSPDSQRIVFTSSAYHDNDEIYTIRPDGSDRIRLTNNKKFDWFASWSPGGRRLAYNSERFGGQELMLANVDGGAHIRISMAEKTYEQEPTWSPDGKMLAYAGKMSEKDYDIYRVSTRGFDLDGLDSPVGMPVNLTNNDDRDDMSPHWRSF